MHTVLNTSSVFAKLEGYELVCVCSYREDIVITF